MLGTGLDVDQAFLAILEVDTDGVDRAVREAIRNLPGSSGEDIEDLEEMVFIMERDWKNYVAAYRLGKRLQDPDAATLKELREKFAKLGNGGIWALRRILEQKRYWESYQCQSY